MHELSIQSVKNMDPIVCALSECTRAAFSYIWPDDDSFEPKYVAEFLIFITTGIVVFLTGINYYINFGNPKAIYTAYHHSLLL